MTDSELRDKLASEYAVAQMAEANRCCERCESQAKATFSEGMGYGQRAFKAGWDAARANDSTLRQTAGYELGRRAVEVTENALHACQKERDQLRAEVEKLHKRLGVACLDHDLVHYLACGRCMDQLRAELEDERQALSVLRSANRVNIDECDRLKRMVDVMRDGLHDIYSQPEFAQTYSAEVLAEVEKLERGE